MKYKLLCSDLDGTLLSSKYDVSDLAVSEFSKIKNYLKIILVSARMPRAMIYLQKRLGIENGPLICYNGALITQGGNVKSSTTMEIGLVEALIHIAKKYQIHVGLYYKDEWYADKNTDLIQNEIYCTRCTPLFRETPDTIADFHQRKIGIHKIMLMGPQTALDRIYPELKKAFGTALQLYRSTSNILEVNDGSVSKLSAIQSLLTNSESLEQIIAFGDNYNDIEMLQKVGLGVAVGNARKEVKDAADKITLANTEDGVAYYIKNYLMT